MPHRPTITIPQPCHESWAQMTPAAQGRHCAACQKTVIDFTQLTDADLLQFFKQSSGKVCGRFVAAQLKRPLRAAAAPGCALWRVWLASVVVVLSLRAILPPTARAQTPVARQAADSLPLAQSRVQRPEASDSVAITGIVVDSTTSQPLYGVTVLLKGTNIGVSSDTDGKFLLEVPITFFARDASPVITFLYVAYISQEVSLSLSQAHQPLRLRLSPDRQFIDCDFTQRPRYTPRGLWQRAASLFRRH